MPNHFDQPSLFTIVSAVIPSAEDPTKRLRDDQGNYPTAIHEIGARTWEETFQKIGQDVLGRTIGVQRCATHAQTGHGHLFYQGKPVSARLPADHPYQWR